MTNEKQNVAGIAYGFFYCSASQSEIERTLPKARAAASTPSELELALKKDFNSEEFNSDSELREFAQSARDAGNNYVAIATLPNATNAQTAGELGDIQNALYLSDLQRAFHKGSENYWGALVYKEGEKYKFRE